MPGRDRDKRFVIASVPACNAGERGNPAPRSGDCCVPLGFARAPRNDIKRATRRVAPTSDSNYVLHPLSHSPGLHVSQSQFPGPSRSELDSHAPLCYAEEAIRSLPILVPFWGNSEELTTRRLFCCSFSISTNPITYFYFLEELWQAKNVFLSLSY